MTALHGRQIPIGDGDPNVEFIPATVSIVETDPADGCTHCGTADIDRITPVTGPVTAMTQAAPYPSFDGTQACASPGVDPEIFFGEGQGDTRNRVHAALAVCGTCAFKQPCAAYALTHQVYGIWGGTTSPTRHEIRRKHGIKPHQLELSDTHTRIEAVQRLTENGLSAAEIADRLELAQRSVVRIRGRNSA